MLRLYAEPYSAMLLTLLLYAAVVAGAATHSATVKLDGATVIGTSNGSVTQFLGIPFAEPPYVCVCSKLYDGAYHHVFDSVGKLRLQLPQPIRRYSGVVNATAFGNQCLQQTMPPAVFPNTTVLPPEIAPFVAAMGVPPPVPQSEDCECCARHG